MGVNEPKADSIGTPVPVGHGLSEWIRDVRSLLALAQSGHTQAGAAMARASAQEGGVAASQAAAQDHALRASMQKLERRVAAMGKLTADHKAAWAALRDRFYGALKPPRRLADAEAALADIGKLQDAWQDAPTPLERSEHERRRDADALAVAERAAVQAQLDALTRDYFALKDRSADENARWVVLKEEAQAVVSGADFDAARAALLPLQALIGSTAAAIAQRAAARAEQLRRRQVLAMLRRRQQAEADYSLIVARENLDTRNPSADHNDLDDKLHQGRLKCTAAVDAVADLLAEPVAAPFKQAHAAALSELAALHGTAKAREDLLRTVQVKACNEELAKQAAESMKGVPATELPQFRVAMRKEMAVAKAWGEGRPEQQLAVLQGVLDNLVPLKPYVAERAAHAESLEKLRSDGRSLPSHLATLDRLFSDAQIDADARLASGMAAEGVFAVLADEILRVQAFNVEREAMDEAAVAAHRQWDILKARADAQQSTALPALLAALPAAEDLGFDQIAAGRAQAEGAAQKLADAALLHADFDAGHRAWSALPALCQGSLAPAGKKLTQALAVLKVSVLTAGYAATLEWFNPGQGEGAKAAMGSINAAVAAAASKAAEASKRQDPELGQLVGKGVAALIEAIDIAKDTDFEKMTVDAQALKASAEAIEPYVRERILRVSEIDGLKDAPKKPKETMLLALKAAEALKLTDPAGARKTIGVNLDPLIQATRDYFLARKPVGATFNKLVNGPDTPAAQRDLLRRLKKGAEDRAQAATTAAEVTEAAASLRRLSALLPAVAEYVAHRARAAAGFAALSDLRPPSDGGKAEAEDRQHEATLAQTADSVAASTDPIAFAAAKGRLDTLLGVLAALRTSRLKAARADVKAQPGTSPDEALLLDQLCAKGASAEAPGGEACFQALYKAYGPAELSALLKGLGDGRKAARPQEGADMGTQASAVTLQRLVGEIGATDLKALSRDALGGSGGLGVLLEQGFSGSSTALAALAKAYPDPSPREQLKALMDDGFGGVVNMATVIKLGCPSVKQLQALAATFQPADLRALMDEGLGSAEAFGTLLGTGCGRDPLKLKAVADTFDKLALNALLAAGCGGDAASLAGLLADACGGDAAKLKTLTDAFTGAPTDLPKLKEVVDGLGGKDAGKHIQTLIDRHYAKDLAKIKTHLFDRIEAALPGATAADQAARQKLLKAAPSFACELADGSEFSVAVNAEKFNNVRIDHFLDRHSRKHFILGEKQTHQGPRNNIKDEQTLWPATVTADDLKNLLDAAIKGTQNKPEMSEPNRVALPVGQSIKFIGHPLPAHGVTVKICYKKYPGNGIKLTVDQFFPDGNTGIPGTVKTLTVEMFTSADMNALKHAFNR